MNFKANDLEGRYLRNLGREFLAFLQEFVFRKMIFRVKALTELNKRVYLFLDMDWTFRLLPGYKTKLIFQICKVLIRHLET